MYYCDPMNLKDNHPWDKMHLCVLKDIKVLKLIINKSYRIYERRFICSLTVSEVLSKHNGLCSYIKDIIAPLRICSTEQIN